MKQTRLRIEAYQEGGNLGRLEGFRLIVQALGGMVEPVRAAPGFDNYWLLDIPVRVPPETTARCTTIAHRQFDGKVTVTVTGSREEPDISPEPPK